MGSPMVICVLERILNPESGVKSPSGTPSKKDENGMEKDKRGSEPGPAELFSRAGRILFEGGLNNSHSGNLSLRMGDRILITRRGSMLGELTPSDLVEVPVEGDGCDLQQASTEVNVHRSVYRATRHLALVHAHPKAAIALSMGREWLVPVDAEGKFYFSRIPVLAAKNTIGSKEVEEKIPRLLARYPVVVVRGHGAFAAGPTLEDGVRTIFSLEWSCDIFSRCLALGMSEEALLRDRRHEE